MSIMPAAHTNTATDVDCPWADVPAAPRRACRLTDEAARILATRFTTPAG